MGVGEVEVQQVELQPWEWMKKLNERLTYSILSVMNHKDLSEEQWNLIELLYKIWDNGEYPLHEGKLNLPCQNVTEIGLSFDKNAVSTTQISDGTDIVPFLETKNEKDNE